jgi:hypothetical protein
VADARPIERAEYLLPLRRWSTSDLGDLPEYLARVAEWMPVTVIDGSPDSVAHQHAAQLPDGVRHIVLRDQPGANGKANAVHAGMVLADHDWVVVADDDVRWGYEGLRRAVAAGRDAHLVAPQNVLTPQPWHARWDTARSLINRAVGVDPAGTCVLDRRHYLVMGGYDRDCLFENLELARTVDTSGGRVTHLPDLIVERRPPTLRHFWSQRVRQAYDSWAQPVRFAAELALLPGAVEAVRSRRPWMLAAAATASVAVAEVGRRRGGTAHAFAPTAALWAPVWLGERAITSWIALALRLRGGVVYNGRRIRRAAHSRSALRRRRREAGLVA